MINQKPANEIIRDKCYTYGNYVVTSKMFPNIKDGLIPVHRRLLCTFHNSAKNQFVKTSKIVGECISNYHPYSLDENPIKVLIWNEFAKGSGSWGNYTGTVTTDCAAMRYTSCKADPIIEDMAFEFIKSTDKIETESLMGYEPESLPTLFPFCLFGNFELRTIGYGFKSEIPCYLMKDLKKRLFYLLGYNKTKQTIKPNIYNCDILSSNKECEKLLTEGTARLKYKGRYEVDEDKKEITIYAWNGSFESIHDKINNKTDGGLDNDYIRYNDYSKNDTEVTFSISKKRYSKEMFDQLKSVIDEVLTFNRSYSIYTYKKLDDGNYEIKLTPVDTFLLESYHNYKKCMSRSLTSRIEELNSKKEEYDIIKEIKPHLEEFVKYIDKQKDFDAEKCYKYLQRKTKINWESIKKVFEKYLLKSLISSKFDTEKIIKEIEDVKYKLNNIDETVKNKYEKY